MGIRTPIAELACFLLQESRHTLGRHKEYYYPFVLLPCSRFSSNLSPEYPSRVQFNRSTELSK